MPGTINYMLRVLIFEFCPNPSTTAELARELAGAAHGTSQHNGVERRQRSQRIYLRRLADGRVQIINNNGQHSNPMTEMMLRSMFAPGALGVRGGDIDNMSYEQILEMFGDGSENRGADEGTIRRLPTSTLTNVRILLSYDIYTL